jgi:hypothetical protein
LVGLNNVKLLKGCRWGERAALRMWGDAGRVHAHGTAAADAVAVDRRD